MEEGLDRFPGCSPGDRPGTSTEAINTKSRGELGRLTVDEVDSRKKNSLQYTLESFRVVIAIAITRLVEEVYNMYDMTRYNAAYIL